MAEVIYHSKKGSSNKFWSYEIKGNKITYRWGRVGTTGEILPNVPYNSADLQKKIKNKTSARKGYELIDEEKKEKETELAAGLGFRTKIQEMDFVKTRVYKNGNIKTTVLDEYDPDESILVHLQDSWSKNSRWLLLSKKDGHKELTQSGVNWKAYGGNYRANQTGSHIMDYLQDMIEKFTTIVTAAFGSLGGRALDDDTYQQAVSQFKAESDMDDAVAGQICKIGFANMGARVLDI